jgi:hypothetical protein
VFFDFISNVLLVPSPVRRSILCHGDVSARARASARNPLFAEGIASFAWSKDGKQISIARGTLVQDAVLIKGFR